MEKYYRKNKEEHNNNNEQGLVRCSELVLPYLAAADLASVSSTCKTLNYICSAITSRRISDASRGLENSSIPFINSVDSQLYAYFIYTPTQITPKSPFHQPWGCPDQRTRNVSHSDPDPPYVFPFRVEGARGCECDHCERDMCCPCSEMPNRECGPGCSCGAECDNRVTQKGVSVKLKIVKDKRKGWGLYSAESIRRGKFICEYAGELVNTKDARTRQQMYDELAGKGRFFPALLVLKEHFASGNVCMRMNVDATRIGNISRFINHSCDGGNLSTVLVRGTGALLPRICFFASRDIEENEELAFSYGYTRLNPKGLRCFCGASCCSGVLPSEQT